MANLWAVPIPPAAPCATVPRLRLSDGKQREYFRLRWDGASDADACAQVGVSPRTARKWRQQMYQRAQAVAGVREADLVLVLRLLFDAERLDREKPALDDHPPKRPGRVSHRRNVPI